MKKNLIKNLSQLARVGVDEKETKSLQEDLEKILVFVSKIKSLSCEDKNLEAELPSRSSQMGTPASWSSREKNVMREDKNPHKTVEYAIGDFVKVKKVL